MKKKKFLASAASAMIVASSFVGIPTNGFATTANEPSIGNLSVEMDGQNAVVKWQGDSSFNRYRVKMYVEEKGQYVEFGSVRTTTLTNFKSGVLAEGKKYKFLITPYTNGAYKAELATFSNEFVATFPVTGSNGQNITPKPAQNIKVSAKAGSAEVVWDKVDGAIRYRVQGYQKNEAGEFVKFGGVRTTTEPTYLSRALTDGGEYRFDITPYIGSSYVKSVIASSAAFKYVATSDEKPVEPEKETSNVPKVNVSSLSITNKVASLSWDAIPNATRYRVQAYVADTATGTFTKDGGVRTVTTNSFSSSTLETGKYYKFEVVPYVGTYVTSSAGTSVVKQVPDTVVDEKPENTPQMPIINVAAPIVESGKATLKWDAITGVTRYRVQAYVADTATGTYVKDGAVRTTVNNELVTSSLTEGKFYKFEVTPYYEGQYITSKAGTSSSVFVPKTVTPALSKIQVNTPTFSNNRGTVSWGATTGATRYQVQAYVANSANGTFSKHGLARTTTSTSLTTSELEAGKYYKFEVTPYVDSLYQTAYAGTSAATKYTVTDKDQENPPITVAKVSVHTPTIKDNTGNISWGAVTGATRYRVQAYVADTATGTYEKFGSAKTTTTASASVNSLTEGKYFKFEVTPYANGEYVTASAGTSSSVLVPKSSSNNNGGTTTVTQVKNVKATANGLTATIKWDAQSSVTKYQMQVYVKNDSGSYERTGSTKTISGTSTTYSMTDGKTYRFVITPYVNSMYNETYSNYSEPLTASENSASSGGSIAEQIKNLTSTISGTSSKLAWDSFAGATRYKIETFEKGSSGNYVTVGSTTTTITNYTVQSLTRGKTYKFVVTPQVSGAYKAANSTNVISKVASVPPIEDIKSTVDANKVSLVWTAVEGASRYKVQAYKKNSSGAYVAYGSSKLSNTTTLDVTVDYNGTYKFEITPYIGSEYVAESGGVLQDLTVQNPNPLVVSAIAEDTTVALAWGEIPGVTSYQIQAYNSSGSLVATKTTSNSTYTFQGAAGDTLKFVVTPKVNSVYNPLLSGTSTTVILTGSGTESGGSGGEQNGGSFVDEVIRNIYASHSYDDVAYVSWKQYDDVEQYRVNLYMSYSGSYYYVGTRIVNGTGVTLYSLTEGAFYYFEITALDEDLDNITDSTNTSNTIYIPLPPPPPPVITPPVDASPAT